jgi:hypothetical protein
MILRGYIVGRIADNAVALIGGSMLPWPDTAGSLAVGDIVQIELVPGTGFTTKLAPLGRRDTNRLLLLDGSFKAVVAIPRTGDVPPRVDLILTEVPAEISEGFESVTADISDKYIEPASGRQDTRPGLSIPPALKGLFSAAPPSSGPIPQ